MARPNTNRQLDLFNATATEAETKKSPKAKRSANPSKATCVKCQDVFLSVHAVAARYKVFPSTIWRWLETTSDFPAPLKLTPGTTRWRLGDLVAYETKCSHHYRSKATRKPRGQ